MGNVYNSYSIIDEFYEKIKGKCFEIEESKQFNTVIESCDDMEIQRISRQITPDDLIKAIKGLSEIPMKKFLYNISRKNAGMIIERYFSFEDLDEADVLTAQNNILNKINKT